VRAAAVVFALVALAQGCGGSDEANPDDFVGVWSGVGTVNTRCGMGAGTNSALSETITITKGVNAPLLVVVGDCSLQMDAKGHAAVLRPGQMCTVTRNNIPATATYSSGNFSVTGIKATFSLAATYTVGDGALVLSCTYLANGTATKMPK
jgi:hypothetical protein